MVFPEPGIGWRTFPPDLAHCVTGLLPRAWRRRRGRSTHRSSRPSGFDAVVAGLGIVPRTELAESAGLAGRRRHRRRRATAASRGGEDVFAAGDVARFPIPALGSSGRVEHEDHANTHGRLVGANAAGARERTSTCRSSTPTCSSSATRPSARLDSRQRGVAAWLEPNRKGVIAYVDDESRPRGFLLWNVWGKVDAARDLIRAAAADRRGRRYVGSQVERRRDRHVAVAIGDAAGGVRRPANGDAAVPDVDVGMVVLAAPPARRGSATNAIAAGKLSSSNSRTSAPSSSRQPCGSAHEADYAGPEASGAGFELVCELVLPAARRTSSSRALLPLRVPPPAVVLAGAASRSRRRRSRSAAHAFLAGALLLQLKTVLDNADGQLARLSGRDHGVRPLSRLRVRPARERGGLRRPRHCDRAVARAGRLRRC